MLPPLLVSWLRSQRGAAGHSGDYASWTEAAREAEGYDAPLILERVTAAARQVRDGRAAFERDSVAFAEPECQWPLLACLLEAQAGRGGTLDVVDFGGSLGSLYFQHRRWLEGRGLLRWRVVEQPSFVATGKREFENGVLSFHTTLDDACASGRPAGIVLSSVLPYLERPHELMAEIARRKFSFVLIDRTGFVRRERDQLTVQRVDPRIYPARYPCWFFNREELLRPLENEYDLKADLPCGDWTDLDAYYGGMYLVRKSAAPTAR